MARLDTLRFAYGGLVLAAPDRIGPLVLGRRLESREVSVARLLGARHVVQALMLAGQPTRRNRLIGAGVDVAHGTSMVGLAAVSRRHRRSALTSAAIAFMWAAAQSRSLGR